MTQPITGGCHCGAVRYEVTASLGFQILCQCRNCQRLTGTAFSALAAVPRRALALRGPTASYDYDNGNGTGIRRRVFCPRCGSGLLGGNPAEDFVTLSASSLDDPALFDPKQVIHPDDAFPWHARAARFIGEGPE